MRKTFVFIAIVMLVAGYSVSAIAAEWSFYGRTEVNHFWESVSKEATRDGLHDDDDFSSFSSLRLGGRVKAGNLGGRFEMGTRLNGEAYMKFLYGTWDFGVGQLMLGAYYTPVNFIISNQIVWAEADAFLSNPSRSRLWYWYKNWLEDTYVGRRGLLRQMWGDANLLPYGGIHAGLNDMVRFSFGGFKIAFITPQEMAEVSPSALDTDVTIPKIEAEYLLRHGPLKLKLMAGYNTYDEKFETASGEVKELTVNSYIVGLGVQFFFGPVWVGGDVYTGQNLGNYGVWQEGFSFAGFDTEKEDIIDNTSVGYMVVVNYQATENLTLEAGYGWNKHKLDMSVKNEDETESYYIQARIALAKTVWIVPEIGKIDYKDHVFNGESTDEGDITYFGLKWEMRF